MKQTFQGNQHTKPAKEARPTTSTTRSTSATDLDVASAPTSLSIKLKEIIHQATAETSNSSDHIEGFRFAHVSSILKHITSSPCKTCCSMIWKGRGNICQPSYNVKETLNGAWSVLNLTCEAKVIWTFHQKMSTFDFSIPCIRYFFALLYCQD